LKLGVTEIRKINFALKSRFEFDYSEYSFYFSKRQLEAYIQKCNFRTLDDFLNHIQGFEQFEETLKEQLLAPENEMFRDPTMWEYLKENILIKFKNELNPTIWLPEISTGEELYSLLIILEEIRLLKQINILVSSSSQYHLKRIKAGLVRNRTFENNEANYKRFNGNSDFGSYFDFIDNKVLLQKRLFEKVSFSQTAIFDPIQVNSLKLVIFRNKMIYYTSNLQNRVLRNITNNLLPGGHLIIGAKENIGMNLVELNLDEVNKFEKVYRKVNR